jgi:hypothetical protein
LHFGRNTNSLQTQRIVIREPVNAVFSRQKGGV